MTKPPIEYQPLRPTIESRMELREFSALRANLEIAIGLAFLWLSFHPGVLREMSFRMLSTDTAFLLGFLLFVAGGTLAMAGSREHLYYLGNRRAEFLWRQIEDKK
jgi:hypothetical protein